MEINKKQDKEEFIRLLKSTEREGVDGVIEELESLGFFDAPASSTQHLNKEGGLVRHSLNVCQTALMLREQMALQFDEYLKKEITEDKVIIASLLHDVCKSDIYVRSIKKRKTGIGTWEDSEGYKVTYKNFPMGHGEKSVVMLMGMGLAMYDEELLAIRWHMGAWDLPMQSYELCKNMEAARKLYPLCTIIQCADTLAAGILERSSDSWEE